MDNSKSIYTPLCNILVESITEGVKNVEMFHWANT